MIGISGKKRSGKNTCANHIAASFLKRNGNIKDFKINELGLIEARKNDHYFTIDEGEFNKYFNNVGVKIYSFADPLKQFCIETFLITHNQAYGTEKEKNTITQIKSIINGQYLTSRQLMQEFGTNICRKMCENCWVNATINKIKKESPKLGIVSDIRFPNEVEAINQVGGKTIRLLRNMAGKDEHSSETVLDDFPKDKFSLVIDNRNMNVDEQCEFTKPYIDQWLDQLAGK